jgi:hypothetical protein
VARLLKKSRIYKPLFFFQHPYPTLKQALEACGSEGWEFLLLSPLKPLTQKAEVIKHTLDALPMELQSMIRFFSSFYL